MTLRMIWASFSRAAGCTTPAASSWAIASSRQRPACARVYSWAPTRSRIALASVTSAALGSGWAYSASRRARSSGPACSQGVDDRQRLLVPREVRGLLAGRLLPAPDPQDVVVELEGEPQRPAEGLVARDDVLVVGGQEGAGLDACRDEGRRLAPDHVEVEVYRHRGVVLAGPDVDVLALAERQAGLVVEAHQAQHLCVAEAELGQPVERDPGEDEHGVAGVDRLRDPVDGPQRRPVAPLAIAVLDVVVDEAEVVAQLHGGGARQGRIGLARDGRVGQQPQERPHPLARRPGPVEAHVVADHLVHAAGRRIAIHGKPEDLRLHVGDQAGQVEVHGAGHAGDHSASARRHRNGAAPAAQPPSGTWPRRPDGTVIPCPTDAST